MTRSLPLLPVLILAPVLVSGCSKPVVDIQPQAGLAGEFCITAADCGDGLSCDDEACCANTGCEAACQALLQKDGSAAAKHMSRNPTVDRFILRKCMAFCCEGKEAADLEAAVSSWARRIPSHGVLPSPDNP